MELYKDENIEIKLKNRNMTQDEILAITFWLMLSCGHEIEITLADLEDQENYLENLN